MAFASLLHFLHDSLDCLLPLVFIDEQGSIIHNVNTSIPSLWQGMDHHDDQDIAQSPMNIGDRGKVSSCPAGDLMKWGRLVGLKQTRLAK